MVERVIEERAGGDAAKADAVRARVAVPVAVPGSAVPLRVK